MSAGRAAKLRATSANVAPTRLTMDSSASKSKPTDLVRKYAAVLNRVVKIAVAIDNQAKRVSFGDAAEWGSKA